MLSPKLSSQKKLKFSNKFKEIYDACGYKDTNLMSGVKLLLKRLEGMKIQMYISTNKRLLPTKRILKKLVIEKFFKQVFTVDFNNGKLMTKAEVLNLMMHKLKLKREETLYVGDTALDIIATSKNGLKSAIFLNGYGNRKEIFRLEPEYTIRKMPDLAIIINDSYREENKTDD